MSGGTVATDAALEKKRQEEVAKQEELQEAFVMLIETLKKLGGKTEFQYCASHFMVAAPNFSYEKHGFMKYK